MVIHNNEFNGIIAGADILLFPGQFHWYRMQDSLIFID